MTGPEKEDTPPKRPGVFDLGHLDRPVWLTHSVVKLLALLVGAAGYGLYVWLIE